MPRTSPCPPDPWIFLLLVGVLCRGFFGEKPKQHAWRGGGDREPPPSSSIPLFRSRSVGRPRPPVPNSRSRSSSSSSSW
uniref:Uncharacterized protein n=1 Tax=Arundo donax TaxID=35708 RepID=A0A0A8XP37_ARUDO